MVDNGRIEELARAYGLGEPLGPPAYAARGELGRIWRLDTASGTWAVKELLVPVEERDARADVAFQLAAAAAGVRLPRPRPTLEGTVMCGGFRVYEWVDLAAGQQVTPAELGAVTAGLHRVAHPASGPVIPWFSEPIGPARWEALATAAAGEEWSPALDRLLPELVALDALVVAPDPASLTTCHCDVNLENVLRARDDGGVVVLDWENCGPARPSWELAKILADLPDAAAAYDAYRAAGGPGRLAEPADFSMAIAEQGHLLEFYIRRALSPQETDENRSRARGRIGTMLGRPLTTARIDALLA
ncbi:Phosphotransferase enzyme family protein [Nonomuraea solani]|uniref:Phosphotransferase enzyme family protein n=1 Tax=Nonomuraea solani TaxID=1144553 RepID=A0A1H6E063_9ACTN|nr:aminoglycoside phosphotransferase family protein [Nonomuraea solani]SEG90927.1 Phosphotransferase enzyme family protein [Nonomuraea solani]